MQWTPDRNGGFSQVDPQRLYLPPIMDAIYGFQALNVEAQQRNVGSLLQWTRRMIEIRKRFLSFSLGSYEELTSSNPAILVYVREYGEPGADPDGIQRVLCVNNFSGLERPVEMDLRRYLGMSPVDCMGGVVFPQIGELTYPLVLPGYGFYWLHITTSRQSRGD